MKTEKLAADDTYNTRVLEVAAGRDPFEALAELVTTAHEECGRQCQHVGNVEWDDPPQTGTPVEIAELAHRAWALAADSMFDQIDKLRDAARRMNAARHAPPDGPTTSPPARRVDAAFATVELAAVLASTARKACTEADTAGRISTDTLELLARDADYVARRVAMARGNAT